MYATPDCRQVYLLSRIFEIFIKSITNYLFYTMLDDEIAYMIDRIYARLDYLLQITDLFHDKGFYEPMTSIPQ